MDNRESPESAEKAGGKTSIERSSTNGWLMREVAPYWLAAIVESAEDAIISKTLDSTITSWNRGAERVFGYTAEEVIGKSVTILIPPDHPDEEPSILARLRKGERIEHYETVRITKDGRLIDVSLTVSPIRDGSGRIIGASKIARDITDRKKAELRLQEALQAAEAARTQAERASRLKDEFLATVSHELRTPLTSMLGWVRMLRQGRLSETAAKNAIEVIDRNARSQAQLIEDLLDISRIVSGKMHFDIKPLELSPVVNAAVESLRPAADAKNISVRLIIDPSAGIVAGDYERLQQVVWNLLSNAVKFTPRGGHIEIQLLRDESNVQIIVTDNGKGIKPEFLPHAFDRFTQADSSTTRSFGGLGMGLAIVKSIIEMHGGTVEAFSKGEGTGATFKVSLPITDANQVRLVRRAEAEALPELRSREYPPELAGLRVMVVDDEMDTCEMVCTSLEQCGSDVRIVSSASEALAELDKWLPDVLIADISMPEVDGYELIRAVRERAPHAGGKIPAVALTAMARIEDRVKALNAGYQMHVPKPVELDELRAIVASLACIVTKNEERGGLDYGG
jgi:PAS domain S-box-containing protein